MLKRLLLAVLLFVATAAQATVYSLPWGPKPQFVDANGAPMSSGSLLTYVGSSSTPQVTYTDSTGGVANPTTITLNTRGETPNEVWLTGGVTYKFVLKDSGGAIIWTVDGVTGVNDTTASQSEWVVGPTPTFVSATSFTVAGDQTTTFTAGRRVKTTNSGGTVYSTIASSVFGASTTVTVVNDSGTIDSGLSVVSYGLLSAANSSIPSVKLSSGNWTISNTFTASNAVMLSGTVSPSQITSSQNDYSPTSLSTASTLRLNTDASRNITGIAGGADGRFLTLVNVGSNPIVLTNQDASSSAANRFLLKSDTTLAADQSITLRYDNTTARWRPLSGGVTKQPTRTVLTSGSAATYTTPAGATKLYVRLVGGGGGGAGRDANAGGGGGNSSYAGGSVTLTGNGGGGGVSNGGGASAGGTASGGDINIAGQGGNSGGVSGTASVAIPSGSGGNSPFGGGGFGQFNATGGSAAANSGSGGGGGGGAASTNSGGGGGAGGYVEKLIVAPATSYTYTIGAAGSAGSAGGQAGGQGGAGVVIVDEYYD